MSKVGEIDPWGQYHQPIGAEKITERGFRNRELSMSFKCILDFDTTLEKTVFASHSLTENGVYARFLL